MQKLAQKATNYRKTVAFSFGFDSQLLLDSPSDVEMKKRSGEINILHC